ncbi:MAG: hypothetical protein H7256_08830 [Bdellovibrio sp.]|nr:hypothetical protein [Bdellovibrio sp.]
MTPKLFSLFSLFTSILVCLSGFSLYADTIHYDENKFVNCYSNAGKSYYFDWDHFVKTATKSVYYLPVNNCDHVEFLKDIPQEDLHAISEIASSLPESVLFSIHQIENGAHVQRTEKKAGDYIKNRPDVFAPDSLEVLSQLRFEVGDGFATEVIGLFSHELVKKKSCDSLIGTCDFYLCQEQKNPCGLDGYNLSYGYKYCSGSKFKLLNEMETPPGKAWVTEVFQCLQKRSFESSKALSETSERCDKVKSAAFDSHPDCYAQAGFCHLEGREKRKIFSLIKGEIFSAQTIKQGLELLKQCSSKK